MNADKKAKRERSKAYPGADLEECVNMAIRVKRNLGRGRHDRLALAKAMGYSKMSGTAAQKIAAMGYFGILDKFGSEYALSDDSKRITDPLDDAERQDAVREAVYRPSLYRDIFEKFVDDGAIPVHLSVHLHRYHGISSNAADKAGQVFRESAVYAGVIDDQGRFLDLGATERDKLEGESGDISDSGRSQEPRQKIATSPLPSALPSTPPIGGRSYMFPLSEGKASLHLPDKMNKKDIEILRKHIDILEIEVE